MAILHLLVLFKKQCFFKKEMSKPEFNDKSRNNPGRIPTRVAKFVKNMTY
tara:strand:- start:1773 stop:1922 length:150 start_codon:yes stop_codon:yes gene_type:complete